MPKKYKKYQSGKPLITVITVVFNAVEDIENTILSVSKQDYENIEYIVIDGGSIDGTQEILKKYSNVIDYWISEHDEGIYDAMNKGIDVANGDWLNFMNAGDCFSSNSIVSMVANAISTAPENADIPKKLIIGGVNIMGQNGMQNATLMPLKFTKANLNMFATRTVCHQSVFVARKVTPKYNTKYRLKAELNWYYDLVQKINANEVICIRHPFCNYKSGGEGDVKFKENFFERVKVLINQNGAIMSIIFLPFIFLPLLFRFKRLFMKI